MVSETTLGTISQKYSIFHSIRIWFNLPVENSWNFGRLQEENHVRKAVSVCFVNWDMLFGCKVCCHETKYGEAPHEERDRHLRRHICCQLRVAAAPWKHCSWTMDTWKYVCASSLLQVCLFLFPPYSFTLTHSSFDCFPFSSNAAECQTQKPQGIKVDQPDILMKIRGQEAVFWEVTGPTQAGHTAKNAWDLFRLAHFGKAFPDSGNSVAPFLRFV